MTWRASNENERPGAGPRKRRCKPILGHASIVEAPRRPAFRGSRSPAGCISSLFTKSGVSHAIVMALRLCTYLHLEENSTSLRVNENY
jgi:hypothetical protein